jgi:hypothetical protein
MGLRFRRTVRIAPGVRLNFSKSGVSTSVGPRGAKYTIGPRGSRVTLGIPGTGLSWTQTASRQVPQAAYEQAPPSGGHVLGWILLVLVVLAGLVMCSGDKASAPPEPRNGSQLAATGASRSAWVTAKHVNCRADASIDATVRARLGRGTELAVVEESGGWSRVQGPAVECWISSSLLANSPPNPSHLRAAD